MVGRVIGSGGTAAGGYGWPPSYVDLTTAEGDLVQILAGPMESYEAVQLAEQVRSDLNNLERLEFTTKYLG